MYDCKHIYIYIYYINECIIYIIQLHIYFIKCTLINFSGYPKKIIPYDSNIFYKQLVSIILEKKIGNKCHLCNKNLYYDKHR